MSVANDSTTPVVGSGLKQRRRFMSRLGMLGAAAGIGAVGLTASESQAALTATFKSTSGGGRRTIVDTDILNFALQLEYLEAEYYQIAAYGTRLPAAIRTGSGTLGTVTGGRQVDSIVANPNSVVAQYAREIARDEQAHVMAIRGLTGRKTVAAPTIDIGAAFTAAAVAAGVITSGQTFDPYASDVNFLIGSFIFEDVGVTAYNGAAPFIQNEAVLGAAASILAVEAYHAGEIRTLLFNAAQSTPSVFDTIDKISMLRDAADGEGRADQGLRDKNGQANIVVTDANGLAFARTFQQVLNIVYLGGNGSGGFFPDGLNGFIH